MLWAVFTGTIVPITTAIAVLVNGAGCAGGVGHGFQVHVTHGTTSCVRICFAVFAIHGAPVLVCRQCLGLGFLGLFFGLVLASAETQQKGACY